MDYLVISYSNKEGFEQQNYENSLKQFNIKYKIVGQGEKWLGFVKSKITQCRNYFLDNPDVKPEVIICTDAFDVLAVKEIDDLLTLFENCGKRIAVGMETFCFGNCVPLKVKTTEEYKYVNGGFYMGYYQDILNMWSEMISYGDNDDQVCLGTFANKNSDDIYFDRKSEMVGNVNFLDIHFEVKDNSVVRNNGSRPTFIHFPGPENQYRIMDTYGVLIKDYVNHNPIDKYYDYAKKLSGSMFFVLIFYFFIILFFLVLFYFYLGLTVTVLFLLISLALLLFMYTKEAMYSVALIFILFLFLVERYPTRYCDFDIGSPYWA